MIRIWAITLLALTSMGCVSVPEIDYFTLDLRSSGQIQEGFTIVKMRIRTGEAVSRPEIMIRMSPTQIEYYATQRWAAGLDEQVSEKLKAELGGQPSAGALRVDIEGEILAFEQVDTVEGADAHVKLDFTFTIRAGDSGEETEISRIYETTIAADARNAAAVVRALSRATEMLAVQMAEDLAHAR